MRLVVVRCLADTHACGRVQRGVKLLCSAADGGVRVEERRTHGERRVVRCMVRGAWLGESSIAEVVAVSTCGAHVLLRWVWHPDRVFRLAWSTVENKVYSAGVCWCGVR